MKNLTHWLCLATFVSLVLSAAAVLSEAQEIPRQEIPRREISDQESLRISSSIKTDDVQSGSGDDSPSSQPYRKPSPQELLRRLSPIQYRVTQNEETEPAFRNRYWANQKAGVYHCIVCQQPLFSSRTKFKSGTGWPSFYQPASPSAVESKTDYHMVYPRTEIHCSRCDAHLGHVFNDGPPPTGKRYCMNSASLEFEPAK